ncbi:hypothetical protein [Rosistilla ulvae]|uniref:Hemerythrin-like domain-containing protein n=1 Tax=Rosistilla ulvae TaxID=1930277 RepID=A0A517M503_9BACT|nr:hypothetical protein [Rosistilla ulvae]QDS89951.1 hypothetical protein EC9_41530 [Rosistilla ulvae]
MSVSNKAKTVTVNPAFLADVKDLHQELWDGLHALQEMCSLPISLEGKCFEFIGRLSDLRDKLAFQFSVEEAYGYFDDPAFCCPTFARRSGELLQQHRDLYMEIDSIAERAEQLLSVRDLAALTTIIPVAFDRFADKLQKHESAETQLMHDGLMQDIGGGD